MIRVRCGVAQVNGPMAPAPGNNLNGAAAPPPGDLPEPPPQDVAQDEPAGAEGQAPPPAGAQNLLPQPGLPPNQGLQNNILPDIPENPGMAQRKSRRTRKNRKEEGATRKNRKQSGGKRGMNPFMKFAAKERKNIMSSNPGMPVTEVGKELGKRWRALSDSEKSKY